VGHGEEHNETLMLSSGTKKISGERVFFHNVIDGEVVTTDAPINIVFIFDCCYSHTATRRVALFTSWVFFSGYGGFEVLEKPVISS
jgi:hypothetical protein